MITESEIEGDDWEVKITLIYDESLLSDQPPWRSLTSRYHGRKISRSQQFFLTETAICIVERWKKSMGYRFVPECNHAQESHTCHFFSAILAGQRFVEDPKFSPTATSRNDYSPSSSNTLSSCKCVSLLKKRKRVANRRAVRQPRSLQSSYL